MRNLLIILFLFILTVPSSSAKPRLEIGVVGNFQPAQPLLQSEGAMVIVNMLIFDRVLNRENNLVTHGLARISDQDTDSITLTFPPRLKNWHGDRITESDITDFLTRAGLKDQTQLKSDQNRIQIIISPITNSDLNRLVTLFIPVNPGQDPLNLTLEDVKGTGPYYPDSLNHDRLTLSANPHYHGKPPGIKKIGFKFYQDYFTEFTALMRGDIDFIYFADNRQVDWLQDNPQFTIRELPRNFLVSILFNLDNQNPLTPAQRRYIASLFTESEIEKAFDPYLFKPARSIYPIDSKEYTSYTRVKFESDAPVKPEFNRTLDLVYVTDLEFLENIAFYLQFKFQEAGIPVSIRGISIKELTSDSVSDADMILTTIKSGNNPAVMYHLFHTRGRFNHGYSNSRVDSILARSIEPGTREVDLVNLTSTMSTDPPGIFLFYPKLIIIHQNNLVIPPGNDIFNNIQNWEFRDENK